MPHAQCLAPKALVAAKNPTIRAFIEDVFERSGIEVQTVETCAALPELVRQQHPEVVLLELPPEPLSSLDALQRLRADGQRVPVIVVTDLPAESMLEVAIDAGADDYMTTPFSEAVLLAHVHAVLRRSRWQRGQSP